MTVMQVIPDGWAKIGGRWVLLDPQGYYTARPQGDYTADGRRIYVTGG